MVFCRLRLRNTSQKQKSPKLKKILLYLNQELIPDTADRAAIVNGTTSIFLPHHSYLCHRALQFCRITKKLLKSPTISGFAKMKSFQKYFLLIQDANRSSAHTQMFRLNVSHGTICFFSVLKLLKILKSRIICRRDT